MAVDDRGQIFFSDPLNARVAQIRPDGTLAIALAGADIRTGEVVLAKPGGLAFDQAGALLVADRWTHRIVGLHGDGRLKTVAGVGVAGFNGDGEARVAMLDAPTDIVVDAAGEVWVSEDHERRIRRIDRNGRIQTVSTGEQRLGPIAIDPSDQSLILASANSEDELASQDLTVYNSHKR